MRKYAMIEKQIGETPLQALEALRIRENIPSDVPLAYAGRLDPMASGKLLVLIGDECKDQKRYHALDKAYDFEVLLGAESDTGDILGIVKNGTNRAVKRQEIDDVTSSFVGSFTAPYPAYSSKTVMGKPLFLWALEERLHEITIPTITSTIYHLKCNGVRDIEKNIMHKEIYRKIDLVRPVTDKSKELGADFRRDEVQASWKKLFAETQHEYFRIAHFSCICSGGTYMRTLASEIGERLGTKGLAYSIKRTEMGTYLPVFRQHGFWMRRF